MSTIRFLWSGPRHKNFDLMHVPQQLDDTILQFKSLWSESKAKEVWGRCMKGARNAGVIGFAGAVSLGAVGAWQVLSYRALPRAIASFIGAAILAGLFIFAYKRYQEASQEYKSFDAHRITQFKKLVMAPGHGLASVGVHKRTLPPNLQDKAGIFFSDDEKDQLWIDYAKALISKRDLQTFVSHFQTYRALLQFIAYSDNSCTISPDMIQLQKPFIRLNEFVRCKEAQVPDKGQTEELFLKFERGWKIEEIIWSVIPASSSDVLTEEPYARMFRDRWQGAKVYDEKLINEYHQFAIVSCVWFFLEWIANNESQPGFNIDAACSFNDSYEYHLYLLILEGKFKNVFNQDVVSSYSDYLNWAKEQFKKISEDNEDRAKIKEFLISYVPEG